MPKRIPSTISTGKMVMDHVLGETTSRMNMTPTATKPSKVQICNACAFIHADGRRSLTSFRGRLEIHDCHIRRLSLIHSSITIRERSPAMSDDIPSRPQTTDGAQKASEGSSRMVCLFGVILLVLCIVIIIALVFLLYLTFLAHCSQPGCAGIFGS
jgi:hypothetical protein